MQFYSEAEITANIKAERARNGLSQEDVADKLGISRQAYNIWETCPKSLTLDKVEMLANVIGCSVSTLVLKWFFLKQIERKCLYKRKELNRAKFKAYYYQLHY